MNYILLLHAYLVARMYFLPILKYNRMCGECVFEIQTMLVNVIIAEKIKVISRVLSKDW